MTNEELIIVHTPEEFHAEVEKHQKAGHSPIIRGRKLIVYGKAVAELRSPDWGGSRGGGRPVSDRRVPLLVRITQESMDKLNSLTKNKSEYIDNLIKKQ